MSTEQPFHLPIRSLTDSLVTKGLVYELSHTMSLSMPIFPQHVQYTLALIRRHSDPHPSSRPGKSSFASEIVVMSAHTATHIDALGHFSRDGKLHGGCLAHDAESREGMLRL